MTGSDEIEYIRKLYGDKSEQYVSERLAHEETRKELNAARQYQTALLRDVEQAEFKLADDQFWKLKAEQAERERDEARSSLEKAVECLLNAQTLIGHMPVKHPQQAEDKMKLMAQIDSALHIPRG